MWQPCPNERVRDIRGIDLVVGMGASFLCWAVIIAAVIAWWG